MDYEFVPGRDDFPPDEIAMPRQQLAAALAACEAKDDCLLDCAGNINPERGCADELELDIAKALAIQPDASALKAHDIAVFRKGAEYAFEATGGNEGLTVSDEEVIRELELKSKDEN